MDSETFGNVNITNKFQDRNANRKGWMGGSAKASLSARTKPQRTQGQACPQARGEGGQARDDRSHVGSSREQGLYRLG